MLDKQSDPGRELMQKFGAQSAKNMPLILMLNELLIAGKKAQFSCLRSVVRELAS